MTISSEEWTNWISTRESILQEADRIYEHMFGIYLNSAIEVAETRLASTIAGPNKDQHPLDEIA